ncbi:MAG: methyl-accepting chemotaxis protein [Motiliproteus sp.]
MLKSLLMSFKSRLLLPFFIAVILITLVQGAMVMGITEISVGQLVGSTVEKLKKQNKNASDQLQSSSKQVKQTMTSLAYSTEESLTQTLTMSLAMEQMKAASLLDSALVSTADSLTALLARITAEPLYDGDIASIKATLGALSDTENLLFAAVVDSSGELIGHYSDTDNQQMTRLLKGADARQALPELLKKGLNDDGLVLSEQPISLNDQTLGRVVLGLSNQQAREAAAGLQVSFGELTTSTNSQVRQAIVQEAAATSTRLSANLEKIQQDMETTLSQAEALIESGSSHLMTSLLMTLLGMAVAMVIGILVVMRISIISKLQLLTASLKCLSEGEGNLTHRIDINSKDEIGDMARVINLFIEKIQGIVRDANQAASETSSQSDSLSNLCQDMENRAEQQNNDISQVSMAMNEMVKAVQSVTEETQNNLEHVSSIQQSAESSLETSNEVRMLIQKLVNDLQNASAVVNEVSKQSSEISLVLDVIKEIAGQTNLLALNAAIEAARAGESGRGFAVVADEVRTLASKTQQSTENIQLSIEKLQAGTREAVNVTHNVCEQAGIGIEAIAQTDQQLNSISSSIKHLSDMTTSIAAMTEQQTQVANDVNNNLLSISDAAHITVSSVQEGRRSSLALVTVADGLKTAMSRFRV